jgi:hypothetical protein
MNYDEMVYNKLHGEANMKLEHLVQLNQQLVSEIDSKIKTECRKYQENQ